jgi:hypothetical protein
VSGVCRADAAVAVHRLPAGLDRDDLLGEAALGLGRGGLAVAGGGEFLLRAARHLVQLATFSAVSPMLM